MADEASLYDKLAQKLPGGQKFSFHHISTPPTKCDPLYAPPPGSKPERTYCESHFLTVSGSKEGRLVLLFAIEALVFTTKRLTTIFISKADSTGCLAGLGLGPGAGGSIVRISASGLVDWLVEHRQRPGVRLNVSLFARAQGQYLFPSSVENNGKHVLDDRQLVRWWCKTLDPILRRTSGATQAQAYVIVPGFDRQETTSFFPPSWRSDPVEARKWEFGHPLEQFSADPLAPPRCLVPRFPDDPKARYLDELDEELPDNAGTRHLSSPSKKGSGMWKSIKTLSQFWEMMAFRQECSSGRMVGFIWIVFTPDDVDDDNDNDPEDPLDRAGSQVPSSLSATAPLSSGNDSRSKSRSAERPSKRLTGPIIPRAPRVKQSNDTATAVSMPPTSPFYVWPESSRSQVVLDPVLYLRIHDLLLKLDFSSDAAAIESTAKWLEEAATIITHQGQWGCEVVGKASGLPSQSNGPTWTSATGSANDLSSMIVRKKRKADTPSTEQAPSTATQPATPAAPAVNIMSGNLVRKKAKP